MNTNIANDTITMELIKGSLQAARAEMEALIDRTSMSPFIREKKDYFTAFLDAQGRLVVSTSLTLAGNLVDAILELYPAETMGEGDLYLYNDPYASRGGVSHLPDMVFVMPVFHAGKLFAFAEAWGHLWDIGGSVAGSISPHATSTFEEGLHVPPVKVIAKGVLNEEVFRIVTRNSRFPDMQRGDLKAIMAACALGKRRLEDIVARFGEQAVNGAFEFMLDQSEQSLRRQVRERIPDGRYAFRDFIDSDAVTDESYSVHVEITKRGDGLALDFSASDDQALGPVNFVMDDSVPAYITGLYLSMLDPDIRMNAGFERVIEKVTTPARLNRVPNFSRARRAALAHHDPGHHRDVGCACPCHRRPSVGCFQRVCAVLPAQPNATTGQIELCIEGLAVGFGARTYADGIDAVYYIAQKNYPIEFAEMEFGVEIEAFRVHQDSGGPGRYRGGCGIVRDVRVLASSATLGLRMDNCRYPAFGVNGGMSGRPGRVIVNPDTPAARDLATMGDGFALRGGDLLRIITPGGGGWGSPLSRPAEQVRDDVLDGFVGAASARDDYGVVLTGTSLDIDQEATAALRERLSGPTGMYHRGGYFDEVLASSR